MKKNSFLLFLLLSLILFLPGCWDMLDIEKDGFILTLGFDAVEPETALQEPPAPLAPEIKVHLTLEVFSPHLYKKTQGEKSTVVLHSSGASASEALKQAQGQFNRKLSLVHLRAVVVGEEYARQGIEDLVKCLQRCPGIANRFRLSFIQDARAEEVLSAKPLLGEDSVAEILAKTGERDPAYGLHHTSSFTELNQQFQHMQGTAYATRLRLSPSSWISNIGGAVLKDWKLVGWLSPYEVRSANWITGEMDGTVLTVEKKEMLVSYEVNKTSSRIVPSVTAGQPGFVVRVRTDGILADVANCPANGFTIEMLQEIEQALAQKITAEVESALHQSQKAFAADYLGFGNALYNKYPGFFETLNWNAVYPQAPVKVEVTVHINRLGKRK